MRKVIVESPYKGRGESAYRRELDLQRNRAYSRRVCRALALRGDAPYASHILLTQVLDDNDLPERALGIAIGLEWGALADLTVVGIDRGLTEGMRQGIAHALEHGRPIELVRLGGLWRAPEHEISDELWAAVAGTSSITVQRP